MDDLPYSKRELDEKFRDVSETSDDNRLMLSEKIDQLKHSMEQRIVTFELDTRGSLSRIEMQTSKTNGRVNEIETRQSDAEKWFARVQGALAAITTLVVPVFIGLAIYILTHWAK